MDFNTGPVFLFLNYFLNRLFSGQIIVDLCFQNVSIYSVYHGSLSQRLTLCGRASDTVHSCAHQDCDNVLIQSDQFADCHIFGNFHR